MSLFGNTTLIVLGAGLSSRFGSDKLGYELDGYPLAAHLLTAIAGLDFARKILVARGQAWTEDFRAYGFDVVENTAPGRGQGSSLQLGVAQSKSANVLVMLADMPFVTAEHILAIGQMFAGSGTGIVASSNGEYRSPPAMFRRDILAAGMLSGDQGARALLDTALAVVAVRRELRDIDTMADLTAGSAAPDR